MDTSKAKDTANKVDKELTSFLAPVEKEAIAFFARFPHLPKEIVNVLVLIVPYFAILSAILTGVLVLGMVGISIIGLPIWLFTAPGGLFGGVIYMIFTVIGLALTLASIPGLFARSKIGIKSTRLKSLTGEEIIIHNKDLISNKLENYGKAEKRGSIFPLMLDLSMSTEELGKVPLIIEECIRRQDKTEFIRSHVKQVTHVGYTVETFYKVQDHDYSTFRRIHQAVLLGILSEFESRGYKLARAGAVMSL